MKNQINEDSVFNRYPKLTICFIFAFFVSIALFIYEVSFEDPIPRSERGLQLAEYQSNLDITVKPTKYYYTHFGVENLDVVDYVFRTDNEGYIMPSNTHTTPDKTIAFIGGSTTECLFVHEENRFPNKACRLLENKLNMKINSINAGASGMNSWEGVTVLMQKLINKKPDYVVFMYNVNDMGELISHGNYNTKFASQEVISFGKKTRRFIRSIIPHTSAAIKELYYTSIKKTAEKSTTEIDVDSEEIFRLYQRNVNMFVSLCRHAGITPVIMTQANRYTADAPTSPMFKPTVNYEQFKNTYDGLNNIIRKTAITRDVILVDLENAIPKDTKHIYDIVHLNDNGSIKAAEAIAEVLSKNILNNNQ